MKTIETLGVSSNYGYRQGSSHRAIAALRHDHCVDLLARSGLRLHWQQVGDADNAAPSTTTAKDKLENSKQLENHLAAINDQLSSRVRELIRTGQRFLVVGGDHSIAMGTWSGALAACRERNKGRVQRFGLLWIDAHLDAHSFLSSPSVNMHGMPLRALLDDTDPRLRRLCPKSGHLCGKNLSLLGIRSFEPVEKIFLEGRQAKITYMHEMASDGCGATLLQAFSKLSKRCEKMGISIDMDAIDPCHAPGVATPEPGGIQLPSLCKALKRARHFNKIVGLEICEYDPTVDARQRTRHALIQLIKSAF